MTDDLRNKSLLCDSLMVSHIEKGPCPSAQVRTVTRKRAA